VLASSDAVADVNWKVRPVKEDEFEPWTRLFRGYADFYRWPTSDEHQRQIWGWILALERGWAVVRWTTADDNYRARAVYDQLATRTTWITYDMSPESPR
jgi:hypothetical protein